MGLIFVVCSQEIWLRSRCPHARFPHQPIKKLIWNTLENPCIFILYACRVIICHIMFCHKISLDVVWDCVRCFRPSDLYQRQRCHNLLPVKSTALIFTSLHLMSLCVCTAAPALASPVVELVAIRHNHDSGPLRGLKSGAE
jgi:hypothetical protein